MGRSNLIPITRIYDIYPKYTFSKDVMRFMDDIVDIPRAEVFTKDEIQKAIDEVEKYICDVETDTVKAQGMAQALDIFEQTLGEVEDGKND